MTFRYYRCCPWSIPPANRLWGSLVLPHWRPILLMVEILHSTAICCQVLANQAADVLRRRGANCSSLARLISPLNLFAYSSKAARYTRDSGLSCASAIALKASSMVRSILTVTVTLSAFIVRLVIAYAGRTVKACGAALDARGE